MYEIAVQFKYVFRGPGLAVYIFVMVFSKFGIGFAVFAVENVLCPWGPIPVLLQPCSFSCSPLCPVELTALSFLLPSALFPLSYTAANCIMIGFGGLSAFPTQPWSPGADGLYLTLFRVFLSPCCKFSRLLLELGWIVDFVLEVFFHLCFE